MGIVHEAIATIRFLLLIAFNRPLRNYASCHPRTVAKTSLRALFVHLFLSFPIHSSTSSSSPFALAGCFFILALHFSSSFLIIILLNLLSLYLPFYSSLYRLASLFLLTCTLPFISNRTDFDLISNATTCSSYIKVNINRPRSCYKFRGEQNVLGIIRVNIHNLLS